ncbi:MAG TPA: RsmD family RNA methyltransferase [Opitutaceae bacterium]|nr:RsmD family RNA methyltransferase [Opitutaceae bacterium]
MRITGGNARGIPLRVPRGDATRPAMDRLRQSVFSSLGALVVDARFVDLFAGSGSYGLEAWSRGASGGVFVEQGREALECLRTNLSAVAKSLQADTRVCVVSKADALTWTPPDGARAGLVFCDPPYALIGQHAAKIFAQFDRLLLPGREGLAVFEMPGDLALEEPGWECVKRLGGGGPSAASACFYRRAATA